LRAGGARRERAARTSPRPAGPRRPEGKRSRRFAAAARDAGFAYRIRSQRTSFKEMPAYLERTDCCKAGVGPRRTDCCKAGVGPRPRYGLCRRRGLVAVALRAVAVDAPQLHVVAPEIGHVAEHRQGILLGQRDLVVQAMGEDEPSVAL